MTREADTSALSGPRQIAGGLALGAGMVSAAVLTMRPVMFGMEDPSAANTLVASVTVLLAGTALAKAVVEGGFVLPPACVTAPLGFLLFLGLLMTVFATHLWPAEVQLFTWVTHALVFLVVYALAAQRRTSASSVDSDLQMLPDISAARHAAPEERDGMTRVIVATVLATAAVVALCGVYQRYAVLPRLAEEAANSVAGRTILANPLGASRIRALEAFGPFVTSNAFAGYLALLLPLALGFGAAAHCAGRKAAAVTGWAMAGLLVYVLFLAKSTGGAVAAAAGVAAAAAFYWRKPLRVRLEALLPAGRKGRAVVVAGTALLAIALVVAAFVVLTRASLTMRVRTGYWRAALSMIADNPAGVGLGNFGEHYPLYKTPAGWETKEAHNVFLSLAAEAGLAAAVALGFLVRGFLRVTTGEHLPQRTQRSQRGRERQRTEPSETSVISVAEVATVGNLRALGLVGGLTGLLICFVSGPWLKAGLPEERTVFAGLVTAGLFAVWGVVFWLASSVAKSGPRRLPHHVDIRSNALRAGIVGGVVALFVHGLVDFTFRIKGVMFTVAALGAVALAISPAVLAHRRGRSARGVGTFGAAGVPLRVRFRGWRGFILSTAVALSLAFVLWRGVARPMRLAWHSENAKARLEWASRLDRLRYAVRAAASGRKVDRGKVRGVLSSLTVKNPVLSGLAEGLRIALETGTDSGVKEKVQEFAGELEGLSTDSLRRAWRFLAEYLDEEPGDERVVVRLARLGRSLGMRAPETALKEGADRTVKDALSRLSVLSPVSFVPRKELGDLLARQRHLSEAAAAFENAALRYPEKPDLWLKAGDASVFCDHKRAIRNYARALEANRLAEDERTLLYSRYWWTAPKRPPRYEGAGDFPQRLDHIDATLRSSSLRSTSAHGKTPEVAFRRALFYAEIGGFAEAALEIDRALESRPGEVQFLLFRAIFLDMEAARTQSVSGGAGRAAETAWAGVARVQRSAPPRKRISDYTLGLVRSRRGAIRRASTSKTDCHRGHRGHRGRQRLGLGDGNGTGP